MEKKNGKPLTQKQQLAAIRLESEKLQLENLRFQVEAEKTKRAAIARAHAAQINSLDDANRQIQSQQSDCAHRKGGKNMEGILNGHDSNYSVFKHTYPWGELVVICTRCGKEWTKPSLTLMQTDPALYAERLADYKVAVAFPTDNEPSGTQLFIIQRTAPAQQAAVA